MLEEFELPITEGSLSLMDRVMSNLSALNISYEKKIRIEKEIEKFYRLGRQFEFIFIQKIGFFIITHVQTLIDKVLTGNNQYNETVLSRLEELDLHKEQYAQDRDRILVDSPVAFDIDFELYYNPDDRVIGIRP